MGYIRKKIGHKIKKTVLEKLGSVETKTNDGKIEPKYIFEYLIRLVLFISSVTSVFLLGFSLYIGLDVLLIAGKASLMNTIIFFTILLFSMLSPLLLPISYKQHQVNKEIDKYNNIINLLRKSARIILLGSKLQLSDEVVTEKKDPKKKGKNKTYYEQLKSSFRSSDENTAIVSDMKNNIKIEVNEDKTIKYYRENKEKWNKLTIHEMCEFIFKNTDEIYNLEKKDEKNINTLAFTSGLKESNMLEVAENKWGKSNDDEVSLWCDYKESIYSFINEYSYKEYIELLFEKERYKHTLVLSKIVVIFLYACAISLFLLGAPIGVYVSIVLAVSIFFIYNLPFHFQLSVMILLSGLLGYLMGFILENSTSRSAISLTNDEIFSGNIFLSTTTGLFVLRGGVKEKTSLDVRKIKNKKNYNQKKDIVIFSSKKKNVIFIPWNRVNAIRLK